nr:uncharacterized mitochondrial protein AtMg00810-like [Tanacetum cinerariifolium]
MTESDIRVSALRNFNLEVMEFESAQNNTTAKLPILKLGKYEMWVIRIKQYFQVQDYALWEVIENDNSLVSVPQTTQENGVSVIKMLTILGVVITQEDLNLKFLRSLPPEWNTYVVVWMNKADIETMSIDDLYNNFKIFEQDVKKFVGTSTCAQNMAFMTALSISSTNDVNTVNPAYEASTVSLNVNTVSPQVSTTNFSDNAVYAFMVENPNGSNLLQQDLEQIHEDDLEAMDLRWQLSLLSMRAKSEEVADLKREVACKDYEINMLKSEFEKVKQEKKGIEFKIKKFDNASKSLDKLIGSQITDNSKKGLGYHVVPPPHPLIYNGPTKLDLSYYGLDEFKEPESKGYGPRDSKSESNINHDQKSDDSMENSDDSFGKPQNDDKGFINSRCSRHMTGNIAYLLDFKEFDGGYVTFGEGAHGGRISGRISYGIEPTSIAKSLSDSSYVEAMQEELLQFKLQQEEVYVTQPPRFKDPGHPNKVYKVVNAIYGLHQAPRAWYDTLANYLLSNGFQKGKIDPTLFIKKQKGDILLVHIYVDDIIFGSTNKELCTAFEKLMKDKFQMSSMRELTFFLGLQVTQKEDGIFITQDKYVHEILKKFNYSNVKSASTPVDLEKPLVKDRDANNVYVHLYRSMIGSLMYLTSSRLDIMFAACACARFQVTPKTSHLLAVKRIFRYLKGKPTLGLWYPRDSSFELVAYTDSDYARATKDMKSTTGGWNMSYLSDFEAINGGYVSFGGNLTGGKISGK